MKYAAFLLSFLLIFSLQAKTIQSFRDSSAILTVSNMLSENAEDLSTSFLISDKKFSVKDITKCETIESKEALIAFKGAIDSMMRLFPDEEIPYNEALADMNDYLGQAPLTLCKFFKVTEEQQVLTLYFFDNSAKIYFRIDKRSR